MKLSQDCHLCYSLNVYPGNSWEAKRDVLINQVPAIRKQIPGAADAPFAVGLWLDHQSVEALQEPSRLEEAREILADQNYYMFTVNAFPYGLFHGGNVKEKVYQPDWTDERRLIYTCQVADVLASLMPDQLSGSISTLPGSFKPWITRDEQLAAITDNILAAARHLQALEKETGKRIRLAVEMEPECLWATPGEFAAYYQSHITAEPELAPYIGVCYDTCHQELTGNAPGEGLKRLLDQGVPIVKIQLSAAISSPDRQSKEALADYFKDDTYLHQTMVNTGGADVMFADLPLAFAGESDLRGNPWTIHYHIPIYLDTLPAGLACANGELHAVMSMLRTEPDLCPHLEIETYTYSVLPQALKSQSLETSIAREYQWVLKKMKKHHR